MSFISRLLKWLWGAWPIIIPFFILLVHLSLFRYGDFSVSDVNKVISLSIQIIGGLIILYTLDANIGIFEGKNLWNSFKTYLKEFPRIKPQTYHLKAESVEAKTTVTPASLSSFKSAPRTVEERLEQLEEKIEFLSSRLNETKVGIKKEMSNRFNHVESAIGSTRLSIESIERILRDVSVGGVKFQFLGVNLMIYGAITSYLS